MTDNPNATNEHEKKFSPPRGTYAPAAAALGVMLLLWGFLTMWIMSVVGVGLLAWAIGDWVREIRIGWRLR